MAIHDPPKISPLQLKQTPIYFTSPHFAHTHFPKMVNFIPLSLLLIICLFTHVSSNTELRALLELKTSLDPENKRLSSWVENGDPCGFEGVACNEHRKVANLSLQGMGLKGRVSGAIAGLRSLSGLYLHYNGLNGGIPREIGGLTELSEVYLNVNNFSGEVPAEIGNMSSLQVLQLCCNQLTGRIPAEIGSLQKLSVLGLQHNQLTGTIPPSLGNLAMLQMLDLSFNHLYGPIPSNIGDPPELQMLDIQNNSLSGAVPLELTRLKGGFSYGNNSGICGEGFSALRVCSAFDDSAINTPHPLGISINHTTPYDSPEKTDFHDNCRQTSCSNSKPSQFHTIVAAAGVTLAMVVLAAAGVLAFLWYRRQKQKIGSAVEVSDRRLSTNHAVDLLQSKTDSPLVSLVYSTSNWDPLVDGLNGEGSLGFRFSLVDIESSTHYFSEANVLGKGKFSSVYKGILRDGSVVAIKSLSLASCKSEEAEFLKGMNLLVLLRHENLVALRGYCCSRARGQCFLVYEFAQNGSLSRFLDLKAGSEFILDWPTRVSIIHGIATGIQYLHEGNAIKLPIVHQNISAEKILLDQEFKPLILDSGLRKILADDTIYSGLKFSAAMGYLAPEYITTGRFTEQSDIYAFGILVLQILSGKQQLSSKTRDAAKTCNLEELIDLKLIGNFSCSEAAKLTNLAVACTNEDPSQRPYIDMVMQELSSRTSGS